MKKSILLLCLGLGLSNWVHAQYLQFTAHDSLDVNNISAWVGLNNMLWIDPDTSGNNYPPVCSFPKGSGVDFGFSGSLWLIAKDANDDRHLSVEQESSFPGSHTDYWPGPVSGQPAAAMNYQSSADWARFWKIYKTSIDSFLAMPIHTIANTPAAILEWPAKGNPNAKGAAGASLTITTDMAPFIDVNGDGNYNALDGDYPVMRGDEMVWWIFNDMGVTHNQTSEYNLGVDVSCTAFAYHAAGVADNIQFYDFTIRNKSTLDYHGFRMSFKADLDLGYPFDDYIGFDSARRMAIYYNGTDTDQLYGAHPPIAAISMVHCSGDDATGNPLIPAGGGMYYQNGSSASDIHIDPIVADDYDNYMHSKWRDGSSLPNNSNFAFPDNPALTGGNSMCATGDSLRDRRVVISSTDMNLPSQGTATIAMALMITPNAGGCPYTNFNSITDVADSAHIIYYSHPLLAVSNAALVNGIKLFPNPAKNVLHVALPHSISQPYKIAVYDVLGKAITIPAIQSGNEFQLQTTSLPPGIYQVQVTAAGAVWNGRFVK